MRAFDSNVSREHIEAAERRLQAAAEFREGDRVPQTLTASGSFYTKLFGGKIYDYFTDLSFQIEMQARGIIWRFDHLKDDLASFALCYDAGPVQEASVFGCEIQYFDDTSPRIVPCIQDPADIDRLQLLDPADNPFIEEFIQKGDEFKKTAEAMGYQWPVAGGYVPQIHPPLSCACALMEPSKFYELMLHEPVMAQKLLAKCFSMFCKLADYTDRRDGQHRRSLWLADDNSCFISHALYREQVLPLNWALYELYGPDGRHLHADGPSQQHFACYANEMKLTWIDIGGWSDLDAAVQHMKGKTVIFGAMNNRDFYGEFDERLKKKIRHQIATAGPGGGYIFGIGGEAYPGVNIETLMKGFEYAREIGRYPITLPEEDYSDVRYGGEAYGVPKQ